MGVLVAIEARGRTFVDELQRAWDAGNAVLPLDPRLPAGAAADLRTQLRVGDSVEPGTALVVATSGTTGAPKGVELTHDQVAASATATSSMLAIDPDPIAYLVIPRVLAGLLMFPAVVAFADAIGVVGGWGTAINLLDLSTPEFIRGLRLFFKPFDVYFSLIKAGSFGLAVTMVGCFFGFNTSGGAEAVGRATTQAVVVSSMLILVLDAFWAVTLL